MHNSLSEIVRRLAADPEAVCRHYLSNGRRNGNYWIVGDVANRPGRSLYVRLTGPSSGSGAAGKWTDAATGEHGDLLDLIAANLQIATLAETLEEARRFLDLPPVARPAPEASARRGSAGAVRRLWAMGQPIAGTRAARYLASRGLGPLDVGDALRFHPSCLYWRENRPTSKLAERWPALLAKVTDPGGRLTGLHRTWLDPDTAKKAPIEPNRKSMGRLHGFGVRIGRPERVLAAGEGLETTLSLRLVLPRLPVVAALSATHLAALQLPERLHRLYIIVDADPAGWTASRKLAQHARAIGVEAFHLVPRLGDLNDDLRAYGPAELLAAIRPQLHPEDAEVLIDPSPA